MAGKGSAPRKGANIKSYKENWDKIFSMWKHECKRDKSVLSIAKGEPCNWCGMNEDGTITK